MRTVNRALVRAEVLHELDTLGLFLPELEVPVHTPCDQEVCRLQVREGYELRQD